MFKFKITQQRNSDDKLINRYNATCYTFNPVTHVNDEIFTALNLDVEGLTRLIEGRSGGKPDLDTALIVLGKGGAPVIFTSTGEWSGPVSVSTH